MRTVRYHRSGGPEVLAIDEVDPPEPGPGELLVEVAAAGVSLPVVRQTRSADSPWPLSPGGEVAGRVSALGPGVTGWTAGQRVVSIAFGGAYAERAVVPVAFSTAIPDPIADNTAVALLRNGQVALGALQAGAVALTDRVLVTAAAGGVGHLAVQLARALGGRDVVAAVGSPGKEAFLEEFGIATVLSYAEDAPAWDVSVDLVIDGAGGSALTRGISALETFGRLVSFSAAGGTLEVNDLRVQSRRLIGFSIAHLARLAPQQYAQNRETLWRLAATGAIRPAIHAELPLADAADAHRIIEARTNRGKIVLRP
ncbi:MAG TPA: zinc-binding dehydrogenase [Mycobacteriales bacterium]|nr:zinc-binding dehydrogenase [Mycobacteriales bacterium]